MNKESRTRSKKLGINGLSTLEADIMDIVWKHKKTTVREVHETMLEEGYLPYTTVMAAMNNMAQKGILKQNKQDKAYVYSAAMPREKMAASIIDAVVSKVLKGQSSPVVAHMLGLKEEKEVDELMALKDKLES